MSHRFSNTKRTRNWIADYRPEFRKFESWESIPYRFRLLLLEHILLTVQEVLREQGQI